MLSIPFNVGVIVELFDFIILVPTGLHLSGHGNFTPADFCVFPSLGMIIFLSII